MPRLAKTKPFSRQASFFQSYCFFLFLTDLVNWDELSEAELLVWAPAVSVFTFFAVVSFYQNTPQPDFQTPAAKIPITSLQVLKDKLLYIFKISVKVKENI